MDVRVLRRMLYTYGIASQPPLVRLDTYLPKVCMYLLPTYLV